jgi:hypothetical protein
VGTKRAIEPEGRFPPSSGLLLEKYREAFNSAEIYPTLHRTCREMARSGATQDEQRTVLGSLLDWLRQIGAREEYEDAVSDVLDSIEGFCPARSRIYPTETAHS